MQNKGAIKVFAILLALACFFYLSFTWKTRSIEGDAADFGKNYSETAKVKQAAAAYAGGNQTRERQYLDSLQSKKTDEYLDSVKKLTVYDILVSKYTYEECKQKEINLGLDLRGGMNVTLEVSVADIIKGLTNNNPDVNFNKAIAETQKNLGVNNNKDFVSLFGDTYKQIVPGGQLAPLFQTLENKGKIEFNASNDQVITFIRERVNEAVDNSEKTFRSRIDRFGVAQPNIKKLEASGRILIELPGVKDKERVRQLLQGTANLEFWETYETYEVVPVLEKVNDKLKFILHPELQKNDSSVTDSSKVAAIVPDSSKKDSSNLSLTQKLGKNAKTASKDDSIRKTIPLFSIFNVSIIRDESGKAKEYAPGARVGFCLVKDTATINGYFNHPKIKPLLPSKLKLMWAFKPNVLEGQGKVLETIDLYAIKASNRDGKAAMSGDIIAEARTSREVQNGGRISINMTMTGDAAQQWQKLTAANAPKAGERSGHCIAIVMDNMVYSAPTVNGEIAGGNSQITGNFDQKEADALVAILSAGKLPAPARIVEEAVVGPTLGQEAIAAGLTSFVLAFIVILAFMALYYNKAGWVANIALFINVFFIMGILTSLGAVLTLPGIAGIVLTIGLSVDANILIFERIREELALGKALAQAIKEGFKHAMSSIIDSNITLLILGIILYAFGSGPVQGFATTLCIGILSSLFAAVVLSRVIFETMLGRKMDISFDNNMTRNAFKNVAIDFVKRRKTYYAISAAIILLGTVFYFKNGGFNLGVDFKGGRTYTVRFEKDMNTEDVKMALAKVLDGAPEVKTSGAANQLKITSTYRINDAGDGVDKQIEEILNSGLTALGSKYEIVSQQKVGPAIATDILYSAYGAVLFSCLVMFIYIVVRFKKWQYGLGAVVALFHDVLVVLSFYTIFDKILPFSLEIGQDFIAAILTVMGYTMTETVVVFDRIRERLAESGKQDVSGEERNKLINFALNSTLSRTILTSLTVFFVLLVIFIFGGDSIRGFIFALLIGRVIGTYSSLCISTPIVVDFDKKEESSKVAPAVS